MKIAKGMAGLAGTVIASVVLILLGLLYFTLTVWIIKIGAGWAGYPGVDGNWVVLTAGVISAASIIGSALQR